VSPARLALLVAAALAWSCAGHAEPDGRTLWRSGGAGVALGCAGCHGRDALGAREGAVVGPDVRFTTLARVRGYREASDLRRAVADGVAPDGRQLGAAMPRQAVTPAQAAALWESLERLEQDERRGVTDARLTIGVAARNADDGFPAAFAAALRDATEGRRLHGRALATMTLGPQDIEQLAPQTRVLAVVGTPEAVAGPAAVRLAASGALNLFPRGVLIGEEDPRDALGFAPTLFEALRAAEAWPGCENGVRFAGTGADDATTARLDQRLRTPPGASCRLEVTPGRSGLTFRLFGADEAKARLDLFGAAGDGGPGASERDHAALAARILVAALAAAGPDPTRGKLMTALRGRALQQAGVVSSFDFTAPRLGGLREVRFRPDP
jgi:hypothetical protein